MLADEVVILEQGRILQAGATREVFAHPRSLHAATLLGLTNIVAVRCTAPDVLAIAPGLDMPAPGVQPGGEYLVHLPQPALHLTSDGVPVNVTDVLDAGTHRTLTLALGQGRDLHVDTCAAPTGPTVRIAIVSEHARWWPATPPGA